MGSGASSALHSLSNELSQDDVKRLCGTRFDQNIFDSLKDRGGTVTKEHFLVAVQSYNEKRLHLLFTTLCPSGDMDSRNFLKICREIGQNASPNKKFSNPDADIIFQKIKSEYVASKYIDFETFRSKGIPQLATRLGIDLNDLISSASLIDPAVLATGFNRLSSTDQEELLRRNSHILTEPITEGGNSGATINISRASIDAGTSGAAVRRGSATFPSTNQSTESKQINEMTAAMLRASLSEASTTFPIINTHPVEGSAAASTSTVKKRRASMNTISLVVSKPLALQTNNNNNNNNNNNVRRATVHDQFPSPTSYLISPTNHLISPTATTNNRRVTYNSSDLKSSPTLPTIDGSPPDTTVTINTAAANSNTATAGGTTATTTTANSSGLSRHEQKIQYFQRQQQAKLEAARLKEQQALEEAEVVIFS